MSISNFGSLAPGGIQQSYKFHNQTTRQVAVQTGRLQLPDLPCEMIWFKAASSNAGTVYIGGDDVSSVTGVGLVAGDVWGPVPITNTNLYWYIGTVANDRLQYQIVW